MTLQRSSARFFVPNDLAARVSHLVTARTLVVIVDLDALDRSRFATVDRGLLHLFDAMRFARIQLGFLARTSTEHTSRLRHVPGSWWIDDGCPIAFARAHLPDADCVVITDDRDVLMRLGRRDLGLPITDGDHAIRNVLWWLMSERHRCMTTDLEPRVRIALTD